MAAHGEDAGGPDRRMAGKGQLRIGCENPDSASVSRVGGRQNEGRFGKIELPRDLLHALRADAARLGQDRKLIARELRRAEHVNDVKFVFHSG